MRSIGYVVGALLACGLSPVFASLSDAMQCVCKIVPTEGGNARLGGTGFVFRDDEIDYWVLTAGHVVAESRKCYVYFYVGGEESLPIHGRVTEVSYNRTQSFSDSQLRDLGIVKVRKTLLKGMPQPKVAKLAPQCTMLKSYDVVFSVGCADLNWPTAWLGHVQAQANDTFHFVPKPAQGRSGSPIFDKDGKHVIGVVVWRELYHGRAISTDGIYEHFVIDTKRTGPSDLLAEH